MTDDEVIARRILARLQDAVATKDLDRMAAVFAEDAVLFGTAAANFGSTQTEDYLARVAAQDGTIRWDWERVECLVSRPDLRAFAAVGTVGLDDGQGQPIGARGSIRMTGVAVLEGGEWRLRHFHGSLPEAG